MDPLPRPDSFPPFSPVEYELRRSSALGRAEELRREAIADFWRGANDILATAATHTRRSAERWLRRLQRHTAARSASFEP